MIPAEDNPQAVTTTSPTDTPVTTTDTPVTTTDTPAATPPSVLAAAAAGVAPIEPPLQSPAHPQHPAHLELRSRLQTIESHAIHWGGEVGNAIRTELGHLRNLLGL